MSTYTGITIGPIYRTIGLARSTRELWASSYIFSYIMRELATKLDKSEAYDLILPYLGTVAHKMGAGLYPDRIFLRKKTSDQAKLIPDLTRQVISELAQEIATHLEPRLRPAPGKTAVEDYLSGFFQIYVQEIDQEQDFLQLGMDRHNIVFSLSSYLDSVESMPKLPALNPKDNLLSAFFDVVNKRVKGEKRIPFLIEDGFGADKRFDSLMEISARDLQLKEMDAFNKTIDDHFDKVNNSVPDENLLLRLQEQFDEKFKFYHRYFAVVYADGDNIKSTLQLLGDKEEGVREFSRFLFEFAQEAAVRVADYGGLPVYLGGDDLFFLAPVRVDQYQENAGQRTVDGHKSILHLVAELDQLFQNQFTDFKAKVPALSKLKKTPTLSFGINVCHVKSPLYEEIRHARDCLFERAKKSALFPDKHVTSMRLSTHSGSHFTFDLPMGKKEVWCWILATVKYYLQEEVSFENAFARRITLLDPLFEYLVTDRGWTAKFMIEDLADSDTEETTVEEEPSEPDPLAKTLIDLIDKIYDQEKGVKDPGKLLQGIIRFIHFLNRKFDPDEPQILSHTIDPL